MRRLLIHVEGQTEETFVNELLAPHLASIGVGASARILGNARRRANRGGIRAWGDARGDILRHLQYDGECAAALMVDYYGLPSSGDLAWPGRGTSAALPFELRAKHVQDAIHQDVCTGMGQQFDSLRFVPCVVMHEFEGLLFSDCNNFAEGIGKPGLAQAFQAIRDQFSTPEEINDSPDTAPSKRVMRLVPGYQKPLFGTIAAIQIGLQAIRNECPNFGQWITKLETLSPA